MNWNYIKFFLFLLAFSVVCNGQVVNKKGQVTKANRNEYKFYVRILVETEDDDGDSVWKPVGGGTVIDKNWVLTCNHIFRDDKKDVIYYIAKVRVSIGTETIFESNGKIYHHKKFNPKTMLNDIALIELNDPIPENNNYIGLAYLPDKDHQEINAEKSVKFCGRGYTNSEKDEDRSGDGDLLIGKSSIQSMDYCKTHEK